MKIYDLVKQIHESPLKAVLAVTGGGAGAINELLQYGGGSATVLEAVVPYDQNAFNRFVKGKPDKYCSPEAARDLAMAAYQRGITFDIDPDKVVGIGATCSLMKGEQEREGRQHHIYIGIQTHQATRTLCYKIDGNFVNREAEEKFASYAIVDALGEASLGKSCLQEFWEQMGENQEARTIKPDLAKLTCDFPGTDSNPKSGVTRAVKSLIVRDTKAEVDEDSALFPLLDERTKNYVELDRPPHVPLGLNKPVQSPRIILSGSFRPIHQGHIDMALTGHGIYGVPVDFEICVHNVDKPTLNYGEIQERVDGLRKYKNESWKGSTLLTNASTFVQKAEMFPTAKFLVGFDTLQRIGMEKYYYNRLHMLDCIRRIKELDCAFLVFHRMKLGGTDGKMVEVTTAKDFEILPEELKAISFVQQTVPTPISSTELRQQ